MRGNLTVMKLDREVGSQSCIPTNNPYWDKTSSKQCQMLGESVSFYFLLTSLDQWNWMDLGKEDMLHNLHGEIKNLPLRNPTLILSLKVPLSYPVCDWFTRRIIWLVDLGPRSDKFLCPFISHISAEKRKKERQFPTSQKENERGFHEHEIWPLICLSSTSSLPHQPQYTWDTSPLESAR